MLTKEQGGRLLNLARMALKSSFGRFDGIEIDLGVEVERFESAVKHSSFLEEERGVFVTLTTAGRLRGCIGFPEPTLPLGVAVLRAARAAAFDDPRFPALGASELDAVKIEITVLTPPRKIEVKCQRDLGRIKIGKDGLIVRQRGYSGLLLPQVAKEYGWSAQEFLEHACLKAGLGKDAWLEPETKIYRFQGSIFSE